MFQQSFIEGTLRTHRGWTVLLSSALQLSLLGGWMIVSLVRPEVLPRTLMQTLLAVPPMPPPPPPPPPTSTQISRVQRPVPRPFDGARLMEPAAVPEKVAILTDVGLPPAPNGVPGGMPNGVPGGIGTSTSPVFIDLLAPPAPQPPVAKSAPPAVVPRLKIGGNVLQGKLVHGPKPVYPPLALRARIEGTVQFTALIGRDGTVQSLTLVSGHPLLAQAALEAVRQWRYAPTLLNGEPVEVISPIVVEFSLNR